MYFETRAAGHPEAWAYHAATPAGMIEALETARVRSLDDRTYTVARVPGDLWATFTGGEMTEDCAEACTCPVNRSLARLHAETCDLVSCAVEVAFTG